MKSIAIKTWGIVIIGFVFLVAGILVLVPIVVNNIICNSFAQQLFELPLPPQTTIVSREKHLGNLGPTGNHLDFLAVLEIETPLSEQEVIAYYSDILLKPANEVSIFKPKRGFFDSSDIRDPIKIKVILKNQSNEMIDKVHFETDTTNKTPNNSYIIQISDSMYAPGWDLRTH